MKEIIKSFSEHGTLVQPDTLNYRTLKPEKGGMFSTRMKSETRIAAIQDQIRDLQKQKIDTNVLYSVNVLPVSHVKFVTQLYLQVSL